MQTLYLTIKEDFFNEILEGTKTVEYREVKPFWTSRLYDKQGRPKKYDGVYFKAGYNPGVPEMVVEYLGVKKVKDIYHIKLGKVLSKKYVRKRGTKKPVTPITPKASKVKNADLSSAFYIQYHNADKIGRFPFTRRLSLIPEEPDLKYKGPWTFWTTKSSVLNAIGANCFLIVGVGGSKKRYYLWTMMMIKNVKDTTEFESSGPGFNLKKAVLLNNIAGFDDFKKFCGNFGIGFQLINNHPFHKKLLQLARTNIPY